MWRRPHGPDGFWIERNLLGGWGIFGRETKVTRACAVARSAQNVIEIDGGALHRVFFEADACTKRLVDVLCDFPVVAPKLALRKAAQLVFPEAFAGLAKNPDGLVVLQVQQEQAEQQQQDRNSDDHQPRQ